jgi:Cu+-exporting ATPase
MDHSHHPTGAAHKSADNGAHSCCGGSAGKAEVLVEDPVCGMSVDPHTTAHHANHLGRPYHFCSAGCRGKFIADPERYLTDQPQ